MNALEVKNVSFSYDGKTNVLDNVSLNLKKGELVCILGVSGGGKTTLFNVISGLLQPQSGRVLLNGEDITKLPDKKLAGFRRDHLGFVFQDFNLLDTFTIEDNIYLPLVLAGKEYKEMNEKLEPIAKMLGIEELLKKYPYEVSGGQKQRAAVARALITNPRLILADEPTGALDSRSSDELLRLFSQVNSAGQTIVMVTHSTAAASRVKRVLFIKDGEVYHQIYRGKDTDDQLYSKITQTLTVMMTGGDQR